MQRFVFYTNDTVKIPAPAGADRMAYKSPTSSPVTGITPHTTESGDTVFAFSTGTTPANCYFQIYDAGGKVIDEGTFEIRQDIEHAPQGYDPRSLAVRTLEALEAKIAGRALTIQQSKITVGDRSIEYMNSIEELLKWRDHFAKLVARENGHGTPTAQVCRMRRV